MNLISLYFAKINHRPLRSCCVVLCCVVLCCVIVCYVMLWCYVMLCYVMLYSTLKHLASRCRWTSSRDCRFRSLVIRCDSQLSLVRLSASVFTFKVFFYLFVNVSMFLVVRFLCYFSSWCVNYQNQYGGRLSCQIISHVATQRSLARLQALMKNRDALWLVASLRAWQKIHALLMFYTSKNE